PGEDLVTTDALSGQVARVWQAGSIREDSCMAGLERVELDLKHHGLSFFELDDHQFKLTLTLPCIRVRLLERTARAGRDKLPPFIAESRPDARAKVVKLSA